MPLTPEERSATNRRNASKSTGPRTDAGKAASRRNATKHGLRAEVLALPNEDPAVVSARSDAWNDYYRPQSPAAQHLVNTCVAATLLSDRCQRYHEAAVASQVRKAADAWDTARDEATATLAAWLPSNPAAAVRRLQHTAHGCRWLIEQWEILLTALDDRGGWTGPERDQAIRLLGLRPEFDALKEHPTAWLTRFFALVGAGATAPALEKMFQANYLPDLHRGEFSPQALPPREACRAGLRALVVGELEPLREVEEQKRTAFDAEDRAGAEDRALILEDGPSARLFLRYHAEARTAFHRAYGSLVKTLDQDAAADPVVSPDEANPAPAGSPVPAEPVSPNEANPDTTAQETAACVALESAGAAPETASRPQSDPSRPAVEARPAGPTPDHERRAA